MEYNTQRDKIVIMDYGRNVYKLVQYAKTIEDRTKRTQVAEAIVNVMAQVNPHVRDQADYRQKLWDHLFILAGGDLDVDTPFEVQHNESVQFDPRQMTYSNSNIRYRHYGRYTEKMLMKIAEYPEGEEREALTDEVAQDMKRKYMAWNNDSIDDKVIKDQIERMSMGRVVMGDEREIVLPAITGAQPQDMMDRRKKKKKKNK